MHPELRVSSDRKFNRSPDCTFELSPECELCVFPDCELGATSGDVSGVDARQSVVCIVDGACTGCHWDGTRNPDARHHWSPPTTWHPPDADPYARIACGVGSIDARGACMVSPLSVHGARGVGARDARGVCARGPCGAYVAE